MYTIKILGSRSTSKLDVYLHKEKEGSDQPRVLFEYGRHCTPGHMTEEFRELAEKHGGSGGKRKPRATYEPVDPNTGLHSSGVPATHVRRRYGNRMRSVKARPGETATHARIELKDKVVPQDEAHHMIIGFALSAIHPDDIEAQQRAFEGMCRWRDEEFAGVQENIIAQADSEGRDGEGRKFHLHVGSNVVIAEDFEFNGRTYKAGQRLGGDATNIDLVRGSADKFFKEHPEYGITQMLAEVGTPEYEDAQIRSRQRDFWDKTRGELSNHDKARRAIETGLQDCSASLADFMLTTAGHGVEVKEVGLRRGKPTKNHDLSYRVKDSTAWVRGKTLGSYYTIDNIAKQLDRKAQGLAIEEPTGRQKAGPPKPLPQPTAEQLDEFEKQMDTLAAEERAARGVTSTKAPSSLDHDQIRARMQSIIEEYEAEHAGRTLADLGIDLTPPPVEEAEEPAERDQSVVGESVVDEIDDQTAADAAERQEAETRADEQRRRERERFEAEIRANPDPVLAKKVIWDEDALKRYGAKIADKYAMEDAGLSFEEVDIAVISREVLDQRDREKDDPTSSPSSVAAAPSASASSDLDRRPPSPSTASSSSASPSSASRSASASSGKPRIKQIALESNNNNNNNAHELIAIIRKTRSDGGAYVDFQLRHDQKSAKKQTGLHLRVLKNKAGRVTTTRQVTAEQLDQLRRTAGDNVVEINGCPVYGVRAEVTRTLKDDYAPRIETLEPSSRQVGSDVIRQQRAFEKKAQDRQHKILIAQMNEDLIDAEKSSSPQDVHDQLGA